MWRHQMTRGSVRRVGPWVWRAARSRRPPPRPETAWMIAGPRTAPFGAPRASRSESRPRRRLARMRRNRSATIRSPAALQDIRHNRVRNCGKVDITEDSRLRLLARETRSVISGDDIFFPPRGPATPPSVRPPPARACVPHRRALARPPTARPPLDHLQLEAPRPAPRRHARSFRPRPPAALDHHREAGETGGNPGRDRPPPPRAPAGVRFPSHRRAPSRV